MRASSSPFYSGARACNLMTMHFAYIYLKLWYAVQVWLLAFFAECVKCAGALFREYSLGGVRFPRGSAALITKWAIVFVIVILRVCSFVHVVFSIKYIWIVVTQRFLVISQQCSPQVAAGWRLYCYQQSLVGPIIDNWHKDLWARIANQWDKILILSAPRNKDIESYLSAILDS